MSKHEHYGRYGERCMNMGHLDAGLCWRCERDRLNAACSKLVKENENLRHYILDHGLAVPELPGGGTDYTKGDGLSQRHVSELELEDEV